MRIFNPRFVLVTIAATHPGRTTTMTAIWEKLKMNDLVLFFTNNLLCYDRDFECRDKSLFFVSRHHQGLLFQFDHWYFSLICMKRCHDFEAQYKRIGHLCKCLKFGHPKLGDVLKVKRIYNCFLQKLTTTDSTFFGFCWCWLLICFQYQIHSISNDW